MLLEDLTHARFTELLHTKFRIRHEASDASVELTEVEDLRISPRQEQFSILFCGPREPRFEQGIHLFEHEQLGAFELFIVPVSEDENVRCYEAVFNRALKKA